jgi:hypothetical protein
LETDGSIRIAWQAEGYAAIHVYARWWPRETLTQLASGVADIALTNRSVADLRRAMRAEFPGQFDLEAPDADAPDRRVRIAFYPPRGEPNPDPA